MKAIILAGGSGTRLYPATRGISKQLLPVYDKPMIYYPLSLVMQAGLHEILIISTPQDLPLFRRILGDGSRFGLSLDYIAQEKPQGIAQAFLIAESFLAGEPACLILGDNLFHATGLQQSLQTARSLKYGAHVFAYEVEEAQRYGVVEIGENGKAKSLSEKPVKPKSNWAVTGLYFYDARVCELAKNLRPSARGELEITDLNNLYLAQNQLQVTCLDPSCVWLDTGTHDGLLEASNYVHAIQSRSGKLIGSPEMTAFEQGWIDRAQLLHAAKMHAKTSYGQSLQHAANMGH